MLVHLTDEKLFFSIQLCFSRLMAAAKMRLLMLLLAILLASFAGSARKNKTKVLILGAGVAGINAAKVLKAKGIDDFLILEAQDYIGGRFKQADVGGIKVEEGANWIHLVGDDNPIWKLKKKYNLRGHYTNYSDVIVRDETGADVTDRRTSQRFYKALGRVAYINKYRAKQHRPDLSMRAGLNLAGWKPKTPVEKAREYMALDFEYAAKPEVISMGAFGGGEDIGDDFFIADRRGYGHIWREMAKPFKTKIKLDTVVKKILYSNAGVTVKTTKGLTYKARYAICTFSNGVLASDLVKFSPRLPWWKREAIIKLPMAYYTKIFLQFPRRFWGNREFVLYAHKTRGYYPIWMDIDRPKLAPGSKVLHVTMTGDDGHRVEAQGENETLAEIMKELRKVYGQNIPNADRIFYSKWSRNPYVQGSYPNANVGTTDEDFHNLQGNVKSLYFAGDAVEKDYWGFVQSAYYSGRRKAKEVVRCLKQPIRCKRFCPKANVIKGVYLK